MAERFHMRRVAGNTMWSRASGDAL